MPNGGVNAWGDAGDVTTNVDISFANTCSFTYHDMTGLTCDPSSATNSTNAAIASITGAKGTMTIDCQYKSNNGVRTYYPSTSESSAIKLGKSTGTIVLSESEYAGSKDIVTISFAWAWGYLGGKSYGFYIKDSEGGDVAHYYSTGGNRYAYGDNNTLGLTDSDFSALHTNNVSDWSKKYIFTIIINYATKTISTQVEDKGANKTSEVRVVPLNTTNPVKTFTIQSNYENSGRRCMFGDLTIRVSSLSF